MVTKTPLRRWESFLWQVIPSPDSCWLSRGRFITLCNRDNRVGQAPQWYTYPGCPSLSLSRPFSLWVGLVLRPVDCPVLGPGEEGGLSIPVFLRRSEERFFVSHGPYLSFPKSVVGNGSWVPTILRTTFYGLGGGGEECKKTHTRTNSTFLIFLLLGDFSWALVSLFSTLGTLTDHIFFFSSSLALSLHSGAS